jgi:hypothetical protein
LRQIQPLAGWKTLTASIFALYKACHWRRAQTLPPLFFGIIDFRNGFRYSCNLDDRDGTIVALISPADRSGIAAEGF